MSSPSELIRSAARNRIYRSIRTVQILPVTVETVPLARPQPTNHASYSRLMQSHDRIRTRHLSKTESPDITWPKGGMNHGSK